MIISLNKERFEKRDDRTDTEFPSEGDSSCYNNLYIFD